MLFHGPAWSFCDLFSFGLPENYRLEEKTIFKQRQKFHAVNV